MRKLASCVKVAVDFVLPESLPQAFKFAQETNHLGETIAVAPADRHSQDKLQAELSMCLAAVHAVELLQTQKVGVQGYRVGSNCWHDKHSL